MDQEIQNLMAELIMLRTKEKDYVSLEDQIRCLRQRYINLGIDHEEEVRELHTKNDNAKDTLDERAKEIDELHEEQLQADRDYHELKQDYIALNTNLGDKEAELAKYRTEFT